ncbi:MAG TPA: TIGR03435 family protein [Bryobacteraceae bacterium]|nr:TIGR03435 family protein [Bryobacteraceae bacterium]
MTTRDYQSIDKFHKRHYIYGVARSVSTWPLILVTCCWAQNSSAPSSIPEWQRAAGGELAFDVASIKPVASGALRSAGYSIDSGDSFRSTGGRFSAAFPLIAFVVFAYKAMLSPDQRREILGRLPGWVGTDVYEIEARAPITNPTKDQMRLMMQSLLAERFHLALHFETELAPVLALVLAKSGKFGPQLHRHDAGIPCADLSGSAHPAEIPDSVFPVFCDMFLLGQAQSNGSLRIGARNVAMDRLASTLPSLSVSEVSRTVVNHTGIEGKFDLTIEFTPERHDLPALSADRPEAQPQLADTSFLQALREQLGLKLEPTRAEVRALVIDHVERPSQN